MIWQAMSLRQNVYAPSKHMNQFGIITEHDFEPICNLKIDIICTKSAPALSRAQSCKPPWFTAKIKTD